jgi:hypothetical protein
MLLKASRAHRARRIGIFARAKTPLMRDFPTRKKFRGERVRRRLARLHAVQNARIGAERFAVTPHAGAARAAVRGSVFAVQRG